MAAPKPGKGTYIRVLHDWEHKYTDGAQISVKTGEDLLLLKKTSDEWWSVARPGDKKAFHVPATYVEVVTKPANVELDKKKPIPPKPPVKPKTFLKPATEETVLQGLDAVLDTALDEGGLDESIPVPEGDSPRFEDEPKFKVTVFVGDDNNSTKSSSSSSDKLSDEPVDTKTKYVNVTGAAAAADSARTTNSLDRKKLAKPPPPPAAHKKSSSVTVVSTGDYNGEALLREKNSQTFDRQSAALASKYASVQPEEPQYANAASLGGSLPRDAKVCLF